MKLCKVLALVALSLLVLVNELAVVESQEPAFQLPVQLIGFPVIILSVRLVNFIKKLGYTLSPKTYVPQNNRTKREITGLNYGEMDIDSIERKIVSEFGKNACIFENVCIEKASLSRNSQSKYQNNVLDWEEIYKSYKKAPKLQKDMYLLSFFIGDIIGSPNLCHMIANRPGRSCQAQI